MDRKADIVIDEAQVISVVCDVMGSRSTRKEITSDTPIEDLDLSSLDQAEIVLRLGELAGLDEIEADYASELVTVGDLVALMNQLVAGAHRGRDENG
jgi:acyl carrier protein